MDTDPLQNQVVSRLVTWAAGRPDVRAVLLTSTRAKPGTVETLSDYDVVVVVDDIQLYAVDRTWLGAFGEVLVMYQDPVQDPHGLGFGQFGTVTQFADGLHIDFTLWPVGLLRQIVTARLLPGDLDDGYQVLYDPDGLAARLHAPTYRVFVPRPPTAAAFAQWVEEFYSDVPYVAKCLWRDELLPARWCLDFDMKHVYLRQMLEWQVATETGWAAPAGGMGKGLKRRLDPELWQALEATYVDGRISANWQSLFDTLALFRRAGQQVAERLGYTFPIDLDERVAALARRIQNLAKA